MRADYALHEVKGIKESFDNGVKHRIEEYMDNRVISFYDTDEVTEIFTSTEGMDGFVKLGETEAPPILSLDEGYEVILTENRFGGSILLPESTYRRQKGDTSLKVETYLTRQRDQLMKTAANKMLTDAFQPINEAFDSGSDYLAPDGVELIGAHTWNGGGAFDNSDTQALDSAAVDTAEEYAGAFTDPSGKPMPLNFDTIIVKKGSAAANMARKLFAVGITPTAVGDINIYEGEYTIVVTPYITTANKLHWFMRDSSMPNSVVMGIGEYPTMREPKVQNDESILSNVTGFWKNGIVNMPYDWYGSDGTT